MIPRGRYIARAIAGKLGFTNADKPQIAISFGFATVDGQPTTIADPDGEPAHASMPWYGHFTPASEERTIESLRHCGWKGDDLSNLEGLSDNLVEVVVDHEEYQGRFSAKIQWVNKMGGGVQLAKPMDAEQERKFEASMKALAARIGGGKRAPYSTGAAAPTPARAPESAPLTADKLPF